ncbi:MAG: sulfite exporter TauE/SafE family protein [Nitrospirota bacterium]|jgi:sulfite exporter TauE/SafE
MPEIYLLTLAAGLTGGLGHCIGMCGPIVASYSLVLPARSFLPHALYNAGRITTYVLLGAGVALAGSFSVTAAGVLPAEHLHWLGKMPMALAGVFVVLMGASTAGWLPLAGYLERGVGRLPVLGRLVGLFAGEASVGTFYPMGVALGFLPCGLVYSVLMTALGMGVEAQTHGAALLSGMALMFLFGLGTVAPLAAFGKVAGLLGERARKRLSAVSGGIVVLMGVLILVRALG